MKITFTTGLMGSGKSRHLIKNYKEDLTKKVALTARFNEPTGSLVEIKSRNGQTIEAFSLNCKDESDIINYVLDLAADENIESIYIDEIQFLSKTSTRRLVRIAKAFETNLYFYGLSIDFLTDPFESSFYLLTSLLKEDIVYIERTCESDDCNERAIFNARIINNKVARTGELFVEEKSKYLAVCESCYYK